MVCESKCAINRLLFSKRKSRKSYCIERSLNNWKTQQKPSIICSSVIKNSPENEFSSYPLKTLEFFLFVLNTLIDTKNNFLTQMVVE